MSGHGGTLDAMGYGEVEGQHGYWTQNVEIQEKKDFTKAMLCLVMKDSIVENVFAYVIDSRGAENETGLAKQILGLNQTRLIVRSDQEPSIKGSTSRYFEAATSVG